MIRERVEELGFSFEPMPLVILDRFHCATRFGNLVYTAGQVPDLAGEVIKGQVGSEIDVSMGHRAAQLCAVNCLRAVAAVADVDRIVQIVKVLGMVNVADGFQDTPNVINGCSELLSDVFGDVGFRHTRSAVGLKMLPYNYSVEIEMIVAVA